MMPRQPSVPNVILSTEEKYKRRFTRREVTICGGDFVTGTKLARSMERVAWTIGAAGRISVGNPKRAGPFQIRRGDLKSGTTSLQQGFAVLLLEPFNDFGYVLGAVARAEEDGVAGFDEDHVLDAQSNDEFFGGPEEVS